MSNRRRVGLVILACLLCGAAAYVVVKTLVFPPTRYVILPPEQHKGPNGSPPSGAPWRSEGPADRAQFGGAPSADGVPPGSEQGRTSETAAAAPPGPAPDTKQAADSVRSQQTGEARSQESLQSPRQQERASPGPGRPEGVPATFELVRFFLGIGQLESDGDTALTSAQARVILDLVKPLRTQKTLTASDASRILSKIEKLLTTAQRDAIGRMAQPGGPPGGPGQGERPSGATGQGERPSGGSGQGERGPGMGPRMAADANPFNPSGDDPMAKRMAEQIKAVFDALESKAAGKG
jgi:hypothetical protein